MGNFVAVNFYTRMFRATQKKRINLLIKEKFVKSISFFSILSHHEFHIHGRSWVDPLFASREWL